MEKVVAAYIRETDRVLGRIFQLMSDGDIVMEDEIWNTLEDEVESKHLNYHPEVEKWVEQQEK